MSVIHVNEGDEADIEDIKAKLSEDAGTLDYLGVVSDSDPLDFPELYKMIKSVRPRGLKVMLVTEGCSPTILDDLIGAGYIHALDLIVNKELGEEQKRCIEIAKDNRCEFAITIPARSHSTDSISAMAPYCKGCFMFIIKQDRTDPLKKNEMSPLVTAAKGATWNVRTI